MTEINDGNKSEIMKEAEITTPVFQNSTEVLNCLNFQGKQEVGGEGGIKK